MIRSFHTLFMTFKVLHGTDTTEGQKCTLEVISLGLSRSAPHKYQQLC